jgi:hypothetical protein
MIFSSSTKLFRSRPGIKTRKDVDIQIDKFDGGTNVLASETRLKPNEAKESTNLMLSEDGIWMKRWGTAQYGGVSFTNTPDGFSEYKKTDGTRELIVVADGNSYVVDPSAGTKNAISGATFTQGTRCDFAQINDLLYIVNGTDNMARYNGSTLSTYSSISTPAWAGTPLARGAGISAGNYTLYYRVSAVNEVGETLAAAEQSITVDIRRDDWDEADEYIDIDWDTAAGALKYIIYMSDVSGYETKLDETTATTYRDDGSAALNPYIEPPTENTAAGPKFKSIAVVGNRLWGTNDPSNLQRVYWTGAGANLGNFAPGFDGGWVDLETGSRNQCVKVIDFNREVHVVCKTDDGRGSVWEVDLATTTIGAEDIIVPIPTKINAQMGSPAQRSVVHVENDVYFINPFGVFTLGYVTGVLNVLQIKERSKNLRPYIRDAYEPSLDLTCAYFYDSKVFFSIPTSSGEPNRIFLYDAEKEAWIKDWTVGVSQFGEFTDSSGQTHFLGINGTKLVEFSENYEGDQGTAFTWRYVSPRFPVNKDWTKFAFIDRAYVKMRSTAGSPTFSFTGTTDQGNTPTIATDTIESGSSNTGMGWDLMGEFQMGETSGFPTLFAQESLTRFLPIDIVLRDIQWDISGNALADRGVLTGLRATGKLIETDQPVDWILT